MSEAAMVQAHGRQVVRQELNATEIAPEQDSVSIALAAQARAEVEARIVAARRWPRSVMQVRARLLEACERTRFAEAGWYRKPIGKVKDKVTGEWKEGYAEGLSVRFAEEANRCMGNLHSGVMMLLDDDDKRVCRVYVGDLETNSYRETIIVITKTVERRQLKKGQTALRTRVNNYGEPLYIVSASDDETNVKQNALVAKAWRDLINKMLPSDLREECEDKIAESRAREEKRDPTAARKRLADAFAKLGVDPAALVEYLGHELASCSPAELDELRAVWKGIDDNDTTWHAIMEARRAEREDATGKRAPETTPAPSGLAAKADAKRAERGKKITVAGPDGKVIDSTDLDDQPPPVEPEKK